MVVVALVVSSVNVPQLLPRKKRAGMTRTKSKMDHSHCIYVSYAIEFYAIMHAISMNK
jgi:hypothetical protein